MAAIQDWFERGAGGGGALFSPSINPLNPNEMYIASDMGQVFHTTNEGANWESVDFREIQGSNNSKMQYTVNPQIMYSLDYSTGGDFIRPTKSTDGGATWTPIAADPTNAEAYTVVADYNNPNRIIVSDYSTIWLSNDGGATFQQKYSTNDGNGAHIAGAFFDGNNIYIGTNQGVLVSTNNGSSFSVPSWGGNPSGQQILSLSGAKEGGTTRLWIVTMSAGDVYAGVPGNDHYGYAGVYRIDVGQSAWQSITSGITSGSHPFFVSSTLNDIDTVYVGGGSEASRPTVFKSTNGGSNWTSVLNTINNGNVQTGWSGDGGNRGWSYGENAMGFTVDQFDSNRIVITDFGFAHLSEDGGATWRALYVNPADLNPANAAIPANKNYRSSGLDNTTVWGLTWTSPTHMIAANSDIRGVQSYDGGASWGFNYTGHTANSLYRSVVNPTTGVVYAATASVHDMYQSTHLSDSSINGGTGSVLFSTNGGTTWQTMHNFGRVVTWVETDPTNPNRLYASVAHSTDGGIYVTNNANAGAASTWTKLATPPRTQGHAFNIDVLNDGTLVVTYSGRRTDAGFTASSGVFVSTNGGQTWIDRSAAGMQYWTKDIIVDPHDASKNTWYASVFSGWGGAPNGTGGLYKTTNRGQTWTRINDLDRVNSMTISPTNPNEAYLTTEVEGLWYTDNLNSANPTFTQVAGYHFMQPTRVMYNPYNANEVWVASFGGGMRVGYVTPPTASPGSVSIAQPTYTVSETGGSLVVSVSRSGGTSGAVSVSYATANGTAIAGQDYTATTGTLSWADGETGAKTFSIPLINDTLFESNETFAINLSNPTNGLALGANATSTVTVTSDDAQPLPGSVSIAQPTYTVSETGGNLVVSVTRSGGTSGAVSVSYATANGTAIAGQDYTATSGTLSWADGETGAKTFSIPLINDTLFENNETFTIGLSNPTGGLTLGANATSTVTVTSDDPQPLPGSVALAQAAYTVSETGGSLVVSVSRGGGSAGAVSVAYSTANGSATAGQDYTATSGTLSWADGETGVKTFSIPLTDDTLVENNETFTISLSSPTGGLAIGSPGTATVTLTSDDVPPAPPGVLQFSQAVQSIGEAGGSVVINVTRTGGSAGAASVSYSTANGTATAGQDYTATTSGTLNWADGDSSTKSFSVAITNDTLDEVLETISLSLTSANGAALGTQATALIQILDDDDSPPTNTDIEFDSALYETREDNVWRSIYVQRNGDISQPGSVAFTTVNGTAIAGSDYVAQSGVVQFAAGERSKKIDIRIMNDNILEPTETFTVALSSPNGGVLGQRATTAIRITDDEVNAAGTIQFDRATFETQENWGYANINLTRTGGSVGAVSVRFAVTPGTAQAGSDYQAVSGTVNFAAGQKSATVRVYLVDDYVLESLETAALTISNPTGGATLGARATATLSIADDEINSPGALAFTYASMSTQENWGYMRVYVERTDGYIGAVSVGYSTGGGTAVPGVNYTAVTGTLQFADGQRTAYFDVPLINNKVYGGTKTFGVQLSNPGGGARLGTVANGIVSILDDDKP
ncbi:Calx-beta domain-containing protein [Anatilimnocola floriformis]|uniref:Calx-beta domain-containing protein n=1 Tax=Anatilimnocola floriformis TaxID=2948575 RepID=UPI0020C5B037|nr:Calx-beta domain-containing protein [Anatilimnocola floriformis]